MKPSRSARLGEDRPYVRVVSVLLPPPPPPLKIGAARARVRSVICGR